MRRGTQGHVAAPHGPAQRLRGAIYLYISIYIYLFILYIRGFQPFLNGRGIRTSISVELYKPDGFHLPFPCGTKVPHTVFSCRPRGARRSVGSTARVDLTRRSRERRTTDRSNHHVPFKRDYNRRMKRNVAALHALIKWRRGPPITIKDTCALIRSYDGHDLTRRNAS